MEREVRLVPRRLPAADNPAGRLAPRMTLVDAPRMGVVMTMPHPVQGKTGLSAGSTYLETLKMVLNDSKLVDMPFEVPAPPCAGTQGVPGPAFSGSFEWPARDGSFVRTVQGLRGFIWSDPETAVAATIAPEAAPARVRREPGEASASRRADQTYRRLPMIRFGRGS